MRKAVERDKAITDNAAKRPQTALHNSLDGLTQMTHNSAANWLKNVQNGLETVTTRFESAAN